MKLTIWVKKSYCLRFRYIQQFTSSIRERTTNFKPNCFSHKIVFILIHTRNGNGVSDPTRFRLRGRQKGNLMTSAEVTSYDESSGIGSFTYLGAGSYDS
jgi:hypothetical protein